MGFFPHGIDAAKNDQTIATRIHTYEIHVYWQWLITFTYLVGGWTNPSETYARQIGSFPLDSGENKRHLKPPPRYIHPIYVSQSFPSSDVFYLFSPLQCVYLQDGPFVGGPIAPCFSPGMEAHRPGPNLHGWFLSFRCRFNGCIFGSLNGW